MSPRLAALFLTAGSHRKFTWRHFTWRHLFWRHVSAPCPDRVKTGNSILIAIYFICAFKQAVKLSSPTRCLWPRLKLGQAC